MWGYESLAYPNLQQQSQFTTTSTIQADTDHDDEDFRATSDSESSSESSALGDVEEYICYAVERQGKFQSFTF